MAAKKKRKKHKESILHEKDGTCFLCMQDGFFCQYGVVHKHHIFMGPNRVHSEAHGLTVYLCPRHHEFSKDAVHENIENSRILQRIAQRAFEREHSREEFMQIFGRNYLEE